MKITDIIKKFPIDNEFYTVENFAGYERVIKHTVYGYRTDLSGDILLISIEGNEMINTFSYKKCYLSYGEAASKMKPAPTTKKIAIDENGREIDFALFDGDRTINVPIKYKTHISHCCVVHGCKYGDDNCPVVKKQMLQLYRCEDCDSEETTWTDIKNTFKAGEIK